MAKRRIYLSNRRQRAVLTDMLPFEVPPTFSNRGFYFFLRKFDVRIEDGRLTWLDISQGGDTALRLLFEFNNDKVKLVNTKEWGKNKTIKSVSISNCNVDSIPYNFLVSHNLEGRILSVVHPANQIEIANFYASYSALITYYSSLSEVSIRRPVTVSRYVYHNDKLHGQRLDSSGGVEEFDREYEQLGSYFVYQKYRNIHKFFESYKYHRCEKKYDAMVQVDVSKCFDSIYTHSLPWAILGKRQVKQDVENSNKTFSGTFDAVMRRLNHGETNGIVIGPEFSRIFAELILQSVDSDLIFALEKEGLQHKIDYEAFRYVDDFFIFYNKQESRGTILDALQQCLTRKKLSVNASKIKDYKKPIITDITIAKERVSSLLSAAIEPTVEEISQADGKEPIKELKCKIRPNKLIIDYKTIIKVCAVDYSHLLNYTFAIVENKIDKLLISYSRSDGTFIDQERLAKALLSIFEFTFFAYSASPKVNHTIRVCRMISTATDFLNRRGISRECKHLVFKFIHDNVDQQLEKNKMDSYREVESLYLLIALLKIGKDYWLSVSTLIKHFQIKGTEAEYHRDSYMSHFSITVLLSYMRDKVRYKKLREFVERHVISKLQHSLSTQKKDTEALLLFLDLIVCPYVTESTKSQLGKMFGLDQAELNNLIAVSGRWFTTWGTKFDLAKELDAKRSLEVY